ncbi:MAG TPA: IS5 family transposase [Crenalkalicoccus sp.]|nr:IS5 family transposase [Crenalkalicoccus sp.]
MPFKHHAARRHHIPKARYRVRNWRAYEAGLRRRGDLTLWLDEAAIVGWQAPPRTTPGGQAWYSDVAIELVLTLRLVFHLGLRQAEGFATSVLRLLGQALRVPDHTTLCRRGRGFAGRRPGVVPHGPMHLVIDSTGLKLFGRGEWDAEKHGRARRSWRKLHLAVDAGTGEIVASVLTDNAADDAGEVPALLGQVEGEIASVAADGAYDGEPVYRAVADRQADPPPDVVIPPRASAVPSAEDADAQGQRDRHIRFVTEKGRMAWQRATGYGRRSLAETAVGRFKAIIGPRLRARGLPAQQGEAAIAVAVLNRMIRAAKPVSVRVA